ncbi:MAG: hypothetical protein ABI614_07885, partial [Planctomycetota bacterium]
MRLTIGTKLGLGFAAVLALMVVSSIIVYLSVANMNSSVQVVASCDGMLNGLNNSMAAMRGYIILGDDEKQAAFFKGERQEAWKKIDAGMAEVSRFYQAAKKTDDAKNFDIIKTNLKPFR